MASHWNMEKLVTFGVIGALPAAAMSGGGSVPIDVTLGVLSVVHGHWGLECILTDYVHGPVAENVAKVSTYIFSAGALLGVTYFNVYDVGITEAVRMLWSL